jgi:hypothetical protein
MNPCSILAEIGPIGSTGFDDMLRLIGIAAIIVAVFRGIRSLMVKPAPPVSPAAAAPPQPVAAIQETPPAAAAPAKTPPPAKPDADEIAPEIIAAIAAAVACYVNQSHRIISIKPQSTTWEKAGRQAVLTSHRIR